MSYSPIRLFPKISRLIRLESLRAYSMIPNVVKYKYHKYHSQIYKKQTFLSWFLNNFYLDFRLTFFILFFLVFSSFLTFLECRHIPLEPLEVPKHLFFLFFPDTFRAFLILIPLTLVYILILYTEFHDFVGNTYSWVEKDIIHSFLSNV